MSNTVDPIDKIFGNYGVGNALCVLCKHDIYSHYWNGTHDWDSCKVTDCKCVGKKVTREANTVYECPFETEWVANTEAKAAINAHIDEVKQREVDMTIQNLINYGLFTSEQLNEAIQGRTRLNELLQQSNEREDI